ncbi:MAG: DUF1573 domain-containing protein [Prevotella sp.]|nr:DUF1573 domain-containing protein [Prevotella sp.]
MKKLMLMLALMTGFVTTSMAQKEAEIKFDAESHDFGKFSEKEPVQTFIFSYTNVGEKPLVVNQALASCGCTVPEYTKTPIQPGEKGQIKVTYNGTGKMPGKFNKTITVRTNGVKELTHLKISGEMLEAK